MRKRLGVIILLMAVTAVIFGCSENTSSKKEVTKEDDPEMIFKEAVEKLEKYCGTDFRGCVGGGGLLLF